MPRVGVNVRNFIRSTLFVLALALISAQEGVSQTTRPAREGLSDLQDPTATVIANAGSKSPELRKGGTRASQVQPKNPTLSKAVFIENMGQFDPKVKFQVKIGSQAVWLTSEGIVFDTARPAAAEKVVTADPKTSDAANALPPFELNAKPKSRTIDRLVFSEDFVGASCCSKVEGKNPQPGVYNYFHSGNPKEWRTNVRGYAEVVYHDVWAGIDLRIFGNGPDLEQEIIVQPGGDLSNVQISYQGIIGLTIAKDGSLDVETAFGKLRETEPQIYQEIAGKQVTVEGRFKLTGRESYSFQVGPHATQLALVIDPTLLYSTYLGGSAGNNVYTANNEVATGIGVDASGNAYVTGYSTSTDFPTTPGSFQPSVSSNGADHIFVTKLNVTGSALVYSTYLGQAGQASAISVDSSGRAYITGWTSPPFPTTPNAYAPTCGLSNSSGFKLDFFVTELAPAGDQLLYSSCFNISGDVAYGALYGYYPKAITVDQQGRAYIAGGASPNSGIGTGAPGIPITPNAYESQYPNMPASAFATVFDTTASGAASLFYSTYLGVPSGSGTAASLAYGVAVDSFGKIYVTGSAPPGFPVTPGAFQTAHSSAATDVFVSKLDPSVSGHAALIYATYLGGGPSCSGGCGGSTGSAVAVDGSGSAYVTGVTESPYFPTTPRAFQTTCPGYPGYVFVSKLSVGGSQLVYSTCLAGNLYANSNSAGGIAVDSLGNAYIAGGFRAQAGSTFPVTSDAFQNSLSKLSGDYSEAFLTKLNSTGSGLIYSSYLGGSGDDVATSIAIDQAGDAYIAGHTSSLNFPVTSFAFQPAVDGTGDAFVTKFPLGTTQALSITSITPSAGGNAGTVSPQIFGTGFHAGAVASLSCNGQPIGGVNLSVGPGGRFLNTTFDLTSASPGTCDVVITNPDGTSVTLSQAFAVQEGSAPQVLLSTTGIAVRQAPPEVALAPSKAIFFATATNNGNVDAVNTLIAAELNPGFTVASVEPAGLTDIATMNASRTVSWSIPNLAAGQSARLVYTGTTQPAPAFAAVPVGPVWGFPGAPLPPFPTPLPLPMPLPITGPTIEDFLSCIPDINLSGSNCVSAAQACGQAAAACTIQKFISNGVCSSSVAQCAVAAVACASPIKCLPLGSFGPAENYTPTDPNDLVGPSGAGGQRWIGGAQGLTYVISFSNIPTASVPAQQVIVTQPLGVNVNLSTLSLPLITIPNDGTDISVPVPTGSFNPAANVKEFITSVDLRPTRSLLVNVDALLNASTQTLTWTFTSIDPATGLPPSNPLIGFLPPGEGGNVAFGVKPALGLATGSQVTEQATIVFQGASPMSTAAWTNSIDNTAPVSQIQPLPSAETSVNFTVQWAGTDVGSGIQDFTIYVSDNGGPFTPFQTNTTATSAQFMGQTGHTYGFYSIARDLVGNIEVPKTAADATTTVSNDTLPPITTATISPSPNANGWNSSNVTVSLNSNDNLGGSGVKSITYSAAGAQSIATATFSGSSTSFVISTEGISTISFFSTDNAGNIEATNTLTIRLDKTPPKSNVLSLPPTEPTAAFSVGWSGTDTGSGIENFTIFVSDNGAPFASWLANTTATSATFNGQVGHTYGFYSIATDLAGKVEGPKLAAEATTAVTSSCAASVNGSVSVTRSGFSYSIISKRYAQTLTLTNASGRSIAGPIYVVLDSLSSNASLNNSGGSTGCAAPLGSPYVSVAGTLNAGASTTLVLQFTDPGNSAISYTTRVLSGAGQP
jgi:hypothetical protein